MDLKLVALGLLAVYGAVTFGVRSWIHYRKTGSTGLRGISGAPGSLEWWAGVLLIVAFSGLAAAPVLALAVGGVVARPLSLAPAFGVAGIVVFALGFAATFAAQVAMGTSWRIGVRASEVTTLVTGGPFSVVRNPIFSAMLVASSGLVLMIPSVLAIASIVVAVLSLELQVRFVEEPYLLRTHVDRYAAYAARVGRFLPGIGRMPERPVQDRRGVAAAGVAAVAGATVSLYWLVPANPFVHLSEPPYLAILGYLATLLALGLVRALGPRAGRLEQRLLALFLAAMPLVYVASTWLQRAGALSLGLELAGLVLYGALAWLGGRRSLRLVALGIAAHGLWDVAHYQRCAYIPDWYTVACAVVDISLGAWIWSQLPRRRPAR